MEHIPYRDASQTDLQDYYDTIPPAHQLSDSQSPFASTHDIPLTASYPAAASYMSGPRNYSTLDTTPNNRWLEKEQSSGRKSKWIVIGSLLAIAGLIIVGAVVAVIVSKNHKKSSSLSSTNSPSSVVNQTNPNDPSTFVKNPAYKQSFYGLAYTPYGSQLPECGSNLTDVITDMQIMSQLTTRIRLYGADCNQTQLVLDAIQQTKVNITVYIANYPISTDNNAAYDRQRGELENAIQTFGATHIAGMAVGNEFMLNYLDLNGATDPNGAVGNQGAALLIDDINDSRSMLSNLSLTGTIPVGTADAGAYFNNKVLEAVDFGMANVHPWFANVSISNAAAWTWSFFETNDVALAQATTNKPVMSIAETGWPTASDNAGNESNGPSLATEANLQTFLDTFICQANANGTEYFFFEFFDEPWKAAQFGGVEGHWGLFYSNRTLKNINIPSC